MTDLDRYDFDAEELADTGSNPTTVDTQSPLYNYHLRSCQTQEQLKYRGPCDCGLEQAIKDTKPLSTVRLRKIDFEFDERNLLELEPLDSKHGMVRIEYADGTFNAKGCTRGTLNRTLVNLINAKLEVTT